MIDGSYNSNLNIEKKKNLRQSVKNVEIISSSQCSTLNLIREMLSWYACDSIDLAAGVSTYHFIVFDVNSHIITATQRRMCGIYIEAIH